MADFTKAFDTIAISFIMTCLQSIKTSGKNFLIG